MEKLDRRFPVDSSRCEVDIPKVCVAVTSLWKRTVDEGWMLAIEIGEFVEPSISTLELGEEEIYGKDSLNDKDIDEDLMSMEVGLDMTLDDMTSVFGVSNVEKDSFATGVVNRPEFEDRLALLITCVDKILVLLKVFESAEINTDSVVLIVDENISVNREVKCRVLNNPVCETNDMLPLTLEGSDEVDKTSPITVLSET